MASRQDDPMMTTSSSSTPGVPAGASADQIKRQIDQTRASMDKTVDQLTERVKPRHLIDDLLEWWDSRSGTSTPGSTDRLQMVRESGSAVVERLKDKPLPAALIGAGLIWMMLDNSSSRSSSTGWRRGEAWPTDYTREGPPTHSGSTVDARTGEPYDHATYGAEYRSGTAGTSSGVSSASSSGSSGPSIGEKISTAVQSAKESVSSAVGKLGEWTGSAVGSAGEVARSVADTARSAGQGVVSATSRVGSTVGSGMSSVGSGVSSGVSGAGDYGRYGYERGRDLLGNASRDYPFAIGVAALAAGVVTGLLLPSTRRENELMGEQSEQLKDTAKRVVTETARTAKDEAQQHGSGIVEKVRRVAGEALQAGREAAEREGLNPDQLQDQAKQVAQTAADTARSEVRR